jgi:hypothetical protein
MSDVKKFGFYLYYLIPLGVQDYFEKWINGGGIAVAVAPGRPDIPAAPVCAA